MPLRPNSQLLVAVVVILSNLTLIRKIGKGGLRLALDKVSRFAQVFKHPLTCFEVFRVLTAPETRPVVRADPKTALKYLSSYLGGSFSHSEKASILIDHYAFLKNRVEHGFFQKIVGGRLILWEHVVSNHVYRICITYSNTYHNEGDLSLLFERDHIDLYVISFTIGPGSIAGLTADHTIYIGRVQGKNKGLSLIREATKNCLDISPAALLLSATEGIAMALELDHIIGIGADQQISAYADFRPERLVHTYDDFWIALGGVRLDRGMYHLTPMRHKPINAIQQRHRSRTLRKRAFKSLVKEQVRREFSAVAFRAREE